MAFCPNCGTPNTDQAEKCVNCAEALPQSSGGSKFKGTIMMGVAGTPAARQAPKAPEQAHSPGQPAGGSNAGAAVGFQKTMLGVAVSPPPQAPPPRFSGAQQEDLGTAPTMEQTSPVDPPLREASASQHRFTPPPADYASSSFELGSTPAAPQANATKMMIAVLGGAIIVAALIVGAALILRDPAPDEPTTESAEP